MTSRHGQHLLRTKSQAEKFGLFLFYLVYFFVCCLATPWPFFGYYSESSLTHPMLITVSELSFCDLKVTGCVLDAWLRA